MKYIALLRGINVGKSIKVSMKELKSICEDIGLENVRTYIQSGNVIFESDLEEPELIEKLERALVENQQKQIPVIVREYSKLEMVLANNPFKDANPSQVGVMFFADKVPQDLLNGFKIDGPEEITLSEREIYIHFPNGMGRSKLKLPIKQPGTVRNINTVDKLIELSRETAD